MKLADEIVKTDRVWGTNVYVFLADLDYPGKRHPEYVNYVVSSITFTAHRHWWYGTYFDVTWCYRPAVTVMKVIYPTALDVSSGKVRIELPDEGTARTGYGAKITIDGVEVENVVSAELGRIKPDELVTLKLEVLA